MNTILVLAFAVFQFSVVNIVLQGDETTPASIGYLMIGLICSNLNLYLLTRKNSVRPLIVMFLFFISQYFGFSPAIQIASGQYPGTAANPPEEYEHSSLFFIFAVTLFTLTGYLYAQKVNKHKNMIERDAKVDESAIVVPRFRIVAILVGLNFAYIAFVGINNFFTSFYELGEALELKFKTRVFIAIIRALAILPLATCLTIILSSVSLRNLSKSYQMLIWISIISLFISCNPISSYRIMVGMVWGSLIFAKTLNISRTHFITTFKLYIAALIYLFPLADYFRNAKRELGNPISRDSLTSGDFDSYAQLLNSFAYVAEKGIGWGVHFASLPLFWIPRSFWPGKPLDSAVMIAKFREYPFENLSLPIMAELMLDFGLVGTCLIFLLIGIYLSSKDSCFAFHSKFPIDVTTFVIFLVPYSLMLFRGSLLQAVSPIAIVFVSSKLLTNRRFITYI